VALSLDDVLAIPANVDEERLRRMGLLPQPQPAPSLIAPATAPIPKLSPVTVHAPEPTTEALYPKQLQPLTPQVDPNAVKPMTPPTLLSAPQSSLMGFKSREEARGAGQDISAPAGAGPVMPTTESGRLQVERDKLIDEQRHPWGTAENHPGTLGKIGHVLSRIGNIAGDVVAPATMALIPGTELNRREREAGLENRIEAAKKEETAEEAVRQRPEIAELTGEKRGELQAAKDIAAEQREKERLESAEKIASGRETSAEKIAGGREASAEKIAEGRTKSAEQIARERAESAERIAVGRNLATTEAARIRAAAANDPEKLTNTMKTMKQQAKATLPAIGRALDETEKVAAKLGPVEGRWSDFWQGKVGLADPEYAHYKDEIALISTAVTLAHARGRMSNELFEHFQKMFDAGKQAPENMIQALTVAQEWLTDYAKMGEPPAGGGAGKQIHNGFEYTKGEDGLWHKGKAVQPQ
jgi:hypothetical protein